MKTKPFLGIELVVCWAALIPYLRYELLTSGISRPGKIQLMQTPSNFTHWINRSTSSAWHALLFLVGQDTAFTWLGPDSQSKCSFLSSVLGEECRTDRKKRIYSKISWRNATSWWLLWTVATDKEETYIFIGLKLLKIAWGQLTDRWLFVLWTMSDKELRLLPSLWFREWIDHELGWHKLESFLVVL